MAFLAITNHLCQDIAVVPFMWVIPLSLYLLSFIICFDNERWYLRKTFGIVTVTAILWLTAVQNYSAVDHALEYPEKFVSAMVHRPKFDKPEEAEAYAQKTFSEKVKDARPFVSPPFSGRMDKIFDGLGWVVARIDDGLQRTIKPATRLTFHVDTYDFKEHVFAVSVSYMLVLFLICMVCHGELVKSKPQPKYLTSFYLSISAGGALGGLFVASICPLIFKSHFELSIAMIGGFIVGWLTIFNDGRETWLKGREILQWSLAFALVGTALFAVRGNLENTELHRVANALPASWRSALCAGRCWPSPIAI